jgi:hypothetical protein
MELITRLDRWFAARLEPLRCGTDTKAYVTGVLSGIKADDLFGQRDSIVLAFHEAKMTGDFVEFQRIGDWVLWVDSMHPAFIADHHDVIESIGRMSYYACHRIMRGQWRLYEELADDLPAIVYQVRKAVPHGLGPAATTSLGNPLKR